MKSIVEFLKKNDTLTKGITFVNNANEEYFMSYHEFIEKAKSDSIIRTGDAILVKASHAMHFDKIVEWLKEGK